MEKFVIVLMVFIAFGCFIGFILKFLSSDFLEDGECQHHNTFTSVKKVTATCETTTTECMDCGKVLSGHKTDCR